MLTCINTNSNDKTDMANKSEAWKNYISPSFKQYGKSEILTNLFSTKRINISHSLSPSRGKY